MKYIQNHKYTKLFYIIKMLRSIPLLGEFSKFDGYGNKQSSSSNNRLEYLFMNI